MNRFVEFCIDHFIFLRFLRHIVGTMLIARQLFLYRNKYSPHSFGFYWRYVLLCLGSIIVFPFYFVILFNDIFLCIVWEIFMYFNHNKKFTLFEKNDETSNIPTTIDNSHNNINDNKKSTNIRIMSYNIQSAEGTDGKMDVSRIAEEINRHPLDLCCLQELESNSSVYKGNQTIDVFNKCTNFLYYDIFDYRKQYWGGTYGNSIFTNFPILDSKIIDFPKWQFRETLKSKAYKLDISSKYVDNDVNNNVENKDYLWCFNLHLANDFTVNQQWYQIKFLFNFIKDEILIKENDKEQFRGIVLIGDFNLPSFSTPIFFLKCYMEYCIKGRTWPSTLPLLQLDHCYIHSKNFKLFPKKNTNKNANNDRYDVSHIVYNSIASDHFPIVVILHDEFEIVGKKI